jgi:hypothetical protein
MKIKKITLPTLELLDYIKKYKNNNKNKIRMSILGWEDGDYFIELCKEDGGVIDEHLAIFNNIKKFQNITDWEQLVFKLTILNKNPYLKSKNGNYKFHYDLHLWVNDYYLIYNYFLQNLIIKKLNFLEKIIHPIINTDWKFSSGL